MKYLLYAFTIVCLAACRFNMHYVTASGNVITETKNISDFKSVEAAGSIDVVIKKADEYKVDITADDNLMPYIKINKEGSRLIIKLEDNISIHNSNGIHVTVQMPALNELVLAGSGSLTAEDQFVNPDKIKATIAGSGNLTLNVKSPDVEVTITGSGKATLKGETKDLDINIAGSGDYFGSELKSENATLSVGGSGNATVYASSKLDVSIAGSGDVIYYGSPEISQKIIGSGSIKQAH